MAFTAAWNAAFEALPADGDNVSDGATKIRNLKNSIRERLAIDHYMDIAGTDADHGQHKLITFQAQQAKPAAVANKGFLYTKDIASVVELHWEDESGNEVPLTKLGKYNATAGFSDGTYAITFPTNGMAAAKVMLGNSNTITWFYLNTAPPGWKALSTGADMVLGIAGGTASFNVNGGNPDSAATWAITGGTATYPTGYDYTEPLIHGITGTSGTHTHPVTFAGTWRPKASVGKLFQLDTA